MSKYSFAEGLKEKPRVISFQFKGDTKRTVVALGRDVSLEKTPPKLDVKVPAANAAQLKELYEAGYANGYIVKEG